jgi:hypothetical protein
LRELGFTIRFLKGKIVGYQKKGPVFPALFIRLGRNVAWQRIENHYI